MNITAMTNLYFKPYMWFKKRVFHKNSINLCKRYVKNENNLTAEQKKQIADFYAPYCKVPTIFHSYYFEKTGYFSEKYLPTCIWVNHVDDFYNDRYGARMMDNKCYYPKLFPGIPQATNLACRVNGIWTDGNDSLLNETDLESLVCAEPALFVKKATNSFGGKGVQYIDAKDGNVYEALKTFCNHTTEDLVVQRPLKQHAALSAINESSVNTIRVLSILRKDGVKCYSSVLRMGIGSAKVDNASSGGVTCGINPDGTLKKTAYKPSGESYECHPTSNILFEGYAIPGIHEVWETVQRAHPMVAHFRMISWDFAINEDGHPVMIEANLNLGELDFHQLNNGPVFGDDTKMILDEVFGKK